MRQAATSRTSAIGMSSSSPSSRRIPSRGSIRTASWAAGCAAIAEPWHEAGIEMSDEAVLVCPASIEGGAEAFRRAWQSGLRPTGVLAMSDSIAIGVVRAARDLRIPVPEGLSVVGFDDVEIAASSTRPSRRSTSRSVRRGRRPRSCC